MECFQGKRGDQQNLELMNIILFDNILDSEKYENYNNVKQYKPFMP